MEEYNLTLEQKSYIYGLLITDGTLHLKNKDTCTGQISLEISERDEDIVDKLCHLIPNSTKRTRSRNTNFKEEYKSVVFCNCRQSFIKLLIDFGFPTENKTMNTRPPIVEYDKNAFWRGVIDGDGSLGIRKTTSREEDAFISLTTQSEYLKDAFCEYMKSITGRTYNPRRNKRDNIYNIGCGGHSTCKILNEVYKNCTIYLNRKYEKYLECLQWGINNSALKRNTSGIIGLFYNTNNNKWRAHMTFNKKALRLGEYDDRNDAIRARLQAEFECYGKFAPQQHLFEQYNIGGTI